MLCLRQDNQSNDIEMTGRGICVLGDQYTLRYKTKDYQDCSMRPILHTSVYIYIYRREEKRKEEKGREGRDREEREYYPYHRSYMYP